MPGAPAHPAPAGGEGGQRLRHGGWDCEYFAVNHSIPDALAVAIRTPAGLVLHTGDIKLDQLPLDGRLTDLGGFSRLGDEGVDLFLVDSTNADQPGFVISEGEIGPVLDGMFHRAGARIIVACFASHVHRVQQVLDAAAAHGRQVCFVGRSMVRNMGLAAEMGYLTVPPGLLVEPDDAAMLPDDRIVYVSTGSQGEPLSALARMASGDHRSVRIKPEDTVILASSLIPGNETAVFAVINGLTRLGARVVHQGTARVHVSGHAPAGELLYLYNAVRPSNVMPVHGEWRHLRANAALAVKTGVPEDAVVLAEDGVVVDLVDGKATITGRVEVGRVYVDGLAVGDIGESTLGDRLVLGEGGFIAITVAVDATTGRAVSRPEISGRGFSDDPKALAAVLPARRGRALAHRGGGDHRHPPHRPVGAPGGRQVGRRDLPAPSHDRADGHRRVAHAHRRGARAHRRRARPGTVCVSATPAGPAGRWPGGRFDRSGAITVSSWESGRPSLRWWPGGRTRSWLPLVRVSPRKNGGRDPAVDEHQHGAEHQRADADHEHAADAEHGGLAAVGLA